MNNIRSSSMSIVSGIVWLCLSIYVLSCLLVIILYGSVTLKTSLPQYICFSSMSCMQDWWPAAALQLANCCTYHRTL